MKTLEDLRGAQRALRGRFEAFQAALHPGEGADTLCALESFNALLFRWTDAEEAAVLPAVLRAGIPGRDARRELGLEWTQLRELTRHLFSRIADGAPRPEILGFADNLARRFAAHESEMVRVYYPAAAAALLPAEWALLEEKARLP